MEKKSLSQLRLMDQEKEADLKRALEVFLGQPICFTKIDMGKGFGKIQIENNEKDIIFNFDSKDLISFDLGEGQNTVFFQGSSIKIFNPKNLFWWRGRFATDRAKSLFSPK